MKQGNKNTAGAIIWLAVSCAVHMILFRGKLDMNIPVVTRILFAVITVAVTLPLHEMIHWVFMKLCGMKEVRISFGRDPLGIPSLRTSAQGEMHGWKRIITLLAPLLLLTAVPDILFFFSDRIRFPFFLAALCNAAGCYFDLTDVATEVLHRS
ncbi:MAG: metalloprotease family protein [Clostridia bacterium]|nr:metalloprotease family protein [Clostridia bacterium]